MATHYTWLDDCAILPHSTTRINPKQSAYNYEYLIKEALGESVDEEAVKSNVFDEEKYVVMRFFDFGEGIVKRVSGAEILLSHPMMIDYQLKLKPGDILSQPAYGRLRPGHFIIGGIGREKVIAEAEKIINTVKVEFE